MQINPIAIPEITNFRKRLSESLAWTPFSYGLVSVISIIVLLVMVVWWPLVRDYFSTLDPNYPIWLQIDWLLIGIFAVMSLLIMSGANIKTDAWIIIVGLAGGLAIESWGTQTHLWNYYTLERPPLWIIPAWPTASLAIDRLTRLLHIIIEHIKQIEHSSKLFTRLTRKVHFNPIFWVIFPAFYGLMWVFVFPTLDKVATWLSLLATGLLILTIKNHRMAVIIFIAGSSLGYFLEVWGTTRACWTYYTFQTPPIFAVFAHGFASVAFWRAGVLLKQFSLILSRPR